MDIDVPERDINIIKNLAFNANAKPLFEELKYCLIWPDEIPNWRGDNPSDELSHNGREFLYDLLIVRGYIHRNVPKEEWGIKDPKRWQDVWEFGLANVAQWPGFRRITLSEADRDYLNKVMSTPRPSDKDL